MTTDHFNPLLSFEPTSSIGAVVMGAVSRRSIDRASIGSKREGQWQRRWRRSRVGCVIGKENASNDSARAASPRLRPCLGRPEQAEHHGGGVGREAAHLGQGLASGPSARRSAVVSFFSSLRSAISPSPPRRDRDRLHDADQSSRQLRGIIGLPPF